MGLYPPRLNVRDTKYDEKILPPMKLRLAKIATGVETSYIPIPIYNFLDDNDRD